MNASLPNLAESAVIQLNAVSFCYPQSKNTLRIADWQVKQGERIFLHGKSGSGKTTLLNLLSGILTPEQGSITILDEPFSALTESKRDRFRARHIGVVFQQFNLISHLTVAQNIRLAAHFAGNLPPNNDRLKTLINALHLPADVLQKKAQQLSVGQQQRVAIARALVNEPEILLVDEPTSALDADARDAFMTLLIDLCEAHNTTLIFVSHDQSLSKYLTSRVSVNDILVFEETNAC
ncbi:ABC transporter ATP-binding protein [Aestuariibacter sp. GS-14]|uniref:ABC transporter ATP-binding protein n=1 Tax=Aestuariibacter sp. GS-14 TaxID=2590670 RepID=UPI00112E55A4|nr:ABC transporter ATP-binding protein [Aestuariibacter sp. GS-14]TPV57415.1 ABC transporter ATP-binding protein [Aestuariibacter sp. GS-14]